MSKKILPLLLSFLIFMSFCTAVTPTQAQESIVVVRTDFFVSSSHEPLTTLENGKIKAKVTFSSGSGLVRITLALKDSAGHLLNYSSKIVDCSPSLTVSTDELMVTDRKQQVVCLYVWEEESMRPCAEPAVLGIPITVKGQIMETYRSDAQYANKDAEKRLVRILITQCIDTAYTNVLIPGKIISAYVGDTQSSEYLGMNVKLNLQPADNGRYLLHFVSQDSTTMDIISFQKKDKVWLKSQIVDGQPIFQYLFISSMIDYADLNISQNVRIYSNNRLLGELNNAEAAVAFLKLSDCDQVTLIADSGNAIDRILIMNYQFAQVLSPTTGSQIIETDKGVFQFNKQDNLYKELFSFSINYLGKSLALEDLQKCDILNIILPEGKSITESWYCDIIVTRTVVSGWVDGKGTNDSIYIDGMEYLLNGPVFDEIAIGLRADAYLNENNEIYEIFVRRSLSKNYGFIMDITQNPSRYGTEYGLVLLRPSGKIEHHTIDTSVTVLQGREQNFYGINENFGSVMQSELFESDGSAQMNIARLIGDQMTELQAIKNLAFRMIAFEKSSMSLNSPAISKIEFVSSSAQDTFNLDYMPNAYFTPKWNRFGSYYLAHDNKFFYSPVVSKRVNNSLVYNVDTEQLCVRTFEDLKNDPTDSYDTYFYTTNYHDIMTDSKLSLPMFDIGVIYRAKNAEKNRSLIFVEKVTENNGIKMLTIRQDGESKDVKLSIDSVGLDKIKAWDILDDYQFNSDGELVSAVIIYSKGDRSLKVTHSAEHPDVQYLFGITNGAEPNRLILGNTCSLDLSAGTNLAFQLARSKYSTAVSEYGIQGTFRNIEISAMPRVSSYDVNTGSHTYLTVAKVDSNGITDFVQYLAGELDYSEIETMDFRLTLS